MAAHPLTIVQMVPELHGGGVERGTIELSEELVRQGHRSIVISAGGPLVSQLHEHGAEHVQWNVRSKSLLSLRWIRPLRRYLIENNVDILHARSRIPGWIAYLCWKRMNVATRPHFVTTAHGLYSVNKYSEVMTRGERVIAISETVSSYLKDNYPRIHAGSITTIPRGIDPADFPRHFQPSQQWLQDWYQEFPQLVGRPTISLIGRLTRLKGHLDLIKIVDELRKQIPDIQALIVGSVDPRRAQYAEQVHAEVKRRNLEKNIVFAGQRSKIREIYSVSNVVLSLTSDPPEAFGRTTVEALTMGVPVVGYNHGGTGEILRSIFPEGLVAAGDIQSVVHRIKSMIEDDVCVPDEHHYLKTKMLADTLSVYEELAA